MKIKATLFLSFLSFFLFLLPGFTFADECLRSFNADITVNTDSSIDVVETVVYDTGGILRHGLFRDIRLKNYNGARLGISDIQSTDLHGVPYRHDTEFIGDSFRVKMGSMDATFTGERTFVLKYRITVALGYFSRYDEIYWNATGDNWPFPILKATANVRLPDGAAVLQSACYYGRPGSKNTVGAPKSANFVLNSALMPGEGMTVSVGFTKGIVKKPAYMADVKMFRSLIMGGILPVIVFIIMFIVWFMYGRDPVSPLPPAPQYAVPDGLTPLEAAGLLRQKVGAREISAEIIYLAANGFITIEKTDKKILFFFTHDYKLLRNDTARKVGKSDDRIMHGLFPGAKKEVKLSALINQFYTHVPKIARAVFEEITAKGYYESNPQDVLNKYHKISVGILIAAFVLFFGSGFFHIRPPMTPIFSIAISGLIIGAFGFIMPVRTQKGLETRDRLLGLKQYLKSADMSMTRPKGAPKDQPAVFEKLLPYAMILGAEKEWAKEFEGIYLTPPGWYSYPYSQGGFGPTHFVRDLHGFCTSSGGAMAAPGGSGSGGGGGAGGGGGGGGGGGF